MSVEITGRHIVITPALRSFTLEKLGKLGKYLDGIIETHVVLSVEKRMHRCEITIQDRSCRLEGHVSTGDLYSSIGLAVDKLEKQAKRHKEKVRSRGKNGKKKGAVPAIPAASLAAPAAGSTGSLRIIKSRRSVLKPMSPEDAALELDGEGSEFLVFRSSLNHEMAVVFRRPDGNIGLIES